MPNSAQVAVALVAVAMLGWALYPENPYAYYMVLRVVVTVSAALLGYQAWEAGREVFVWILGATAVLFNPIFPFHLNRDAWFFLDIAAAGVFVAFMAALPVKGRDEGEGA